MCDAQASARDSKYGAGTKRAKGLVWSVTSILSALESPFGADTRFSFSDVEHLLLPLRGSICRFGALEVINTEKKDEMAEMAIEMKDAYETEKGKPFGYCSEMSSTKQNQSSKI